MATQTSRIKQYLKDGRAMRIKTVVNAPRDLGCNARLPNLDELQAKARAANRRILEVDVPAKGTVLASPAFERIARPSADAEGRRTPALRFGDPRVMALAGAMRQTLLAATGFTNKNLRVVIAGLLGSAYTPRQITRGSVEIISNWSAVTTPVCLARRRNATPSPGLAMPAREPMRGSGQDPACRRWPQR